MGAPCCAVCCTRNQLFFLLSDFHVPAPAWSLLLSQEEDPPPRPEASEPADQRQRGAEAG